MAFPVSGILTTFTGTENPISEGGNWASNGGNLIGGVDAQKTGGVLTAGSDFEMRYTPVYGPQAEAYISAANAIGFTQLWLKYHNPGGSQSGYRLDISGGSIWRFYKVVTGTETQVGSDLGTQAVSTGDSFGIEYSGGELKAYYKASAGSWGQFGSTVADTSLQSDTGNIAIAAAGASQFDDMGGGTLGPVVPDTPITPRSTVFKE